MTAVLALTLHGVSSDLLPPSSRSVPSVLRYTLSPETLSWILDRVRPAACVTAADLAGVAEGTVVALTFDDGYRSDFEVVFPALNSRGLRATFFVTTANVGLAGYVTWGQLKDMRSAGMEIGSHGATHRNLLTLSHEEACREIRRSKEELEERLGIPVASFAPVGGHHARWMVDEVRAAGYRVFSSMVPGWTTVRPGMVFLRRNFVQAHYGTSHLERLLRGNRLTLLGSRARYEVLAASRRILGVRRYKSWRSLFLEKTGT